jgi:putative transposase
MDIAKADLFDYIERFHNPRMRRRVARSDLQLSTFDTLYGKSIFIATEY